MNFKIFFIFTCFVILLTNCSFCQVTDGEPFGTYLGTNNNTDAFSNGSPSYYSGISNYYEDVYTGIKWQCVEYARRWWLINYGCVFGAVNFAYQIWELTYATRVDNGEHVPLDKYENGSSTSARQGDLLIYDSGCFGTGHVAVIVEVGVNYIRIAEQNWNNTFWNASYARQLSMTVNQGHYTILENHVLGWMRLRNYNIYSCAYHSQSPDDWIWVKPGDERNFWVKYTNTGTATWNNSENVSDPNSVELWSCNSSGTIVDSWFTAVDWINQRRVTGCDESSVPPNSIATFSFKARIPASSTQDVSVYFRPTHGGQTMENWGGMHFPIHVDADAPSPPLNVKANPADCVPTNNFSFIWDKPPDIGSGIKGYYWKVNEGGEKYTTSTSVPAGAYATYEGNNTFYVRAVDITGNSSRYATTLFCWLPGDNNLSFESDIAPPYGTPDGWTIVNKNGAGYVYFSGSVPDGHHAVQFIHNDSNDANIIGRPANGIIAPETWYRLSFWYSTNSDDSFQWRLSTSDFSGFIDVFGNVLKNPIKDGQWHHYWTAPFKISQSQLNNYPYFTFFYEQGCTGNVIVDYITLSPMEPCP